jgi:hypothetical protein
MSLGWCFDLRYPLILSYLGNMGALVFYPRIEELT